MEKLCPLLEKPCIEHGCAWYIQLLGKNPQTGEGLRNDGWGCTIGWLPLVQLETAQQMRQAAAATESMRNENSSIGGQLVSAIQGAKRLRSQ